MKTKITIFIILNIFGFLLATLCNISYPLFYNTNWFFPAAAIGAVGPILFGWTGVWAGVTFPIFANMVTDPTHVLLLSYIPACFVTCYLPLYLFKKFNCNINMRGWRSILLFSLAGAIIPSVSGGIVVSITLLFVGKLTSISHFVKMVVLWSIDAIPWIIIFGIPIIKLFAPILKDYGLLYGQQTSRSSTEGVAKNNTKSIPILFKILFSLLAIGVVPISFLGAYEIIISNTDPTMVNINAIFICCGFFASLILAGVLTNAIISPIKKLSDGIAKVAGGNFDHRVETDNNDELGILATAFNNMSKTIKAYINKVSEQEKLAAIGRTTSLVAHDVRKPFIMLKTILPLLPSLTPNQTKKYSGDLDLSIRKVEAMLADIMEASREMKYELSPANILCSLDLAIKDVSRYHPDKSIDFYYQFEDLPLIELDEQRICRAFENIIDNAFCFTLDKEGFLWFKVERKGGKGVIVIGNSHSHIPEDKIKKIFQDRFTSGKKSGTGLGLSIVTKVIKGHNGFVSVRNVEQAPDFIPQDRRNIHGVEFVVTLPLTNKRGYSLKDPVLQNSGEAKAKVGMAYKKSQLAGSSEIDILEEKLMSLEEKPNLLILDDESIYRMRVRNVLENLGEVTKYIHVYDASSYNEAKEIVDHSRIDYLICDIDLGDRDNTGFTVLEKAISNNVNCKVLMHTNRKEPEDIERAKRLGAYGFCPKPITEAILVDLLLQKRLWADSQKEKTRNNARKILLLNDDELINMNIGMLLKNSRYSLETFTEIEGALQFYSKNNLYAVLSDINLGTALDGYDFLKEIRSKNNDIPFVFVSGYSYETEWEKAKKAGATEYIQLPLEAENLLKILDSFDKKILFDF